jgi:hypothetical protein
MTPCPSPSATTTSFYTQVSRQKDNVFIVPLPMTVIINCIPTEESDLLESIIKLLEEEISNAIIG